MLLHDPFITTKTAKYFKNNHYRKLKSACNLDYMVFYCFKLLTKFFCNHFRKKIPKKTVI